MLLSLPGSHIDCQYVDTYTTVKT